MKLIILSVITSLIEIMAIVYLCAAGKDEHQIPDEVVHVSLQRTGPDSPPTSRFILSENQQAYLDNELTITARGSYTFFGWNENFLPLELVAAFDLSTTQVESIKAAVLRFITLIQNHEKSIGKFLSNSIFLIPKYPEFQLTALISLEDEISSKTSEEIARRILPCLLLDPAISAGNFDTELVATRSPKSVFAEAKYSSDKPHQTHRLSGNSNVNFFFERYGLVLNLKSFLESAANSNNEQ
jgi:hypothetical protein